MLARPSPVRGPLHTCCAHGCTAVGQHERPDRLWLCAKHAHDAIVRHYRERVA